MGDEIAEEERPERSLLDSSSFIFRGERLTDVDPYELVVEVLERRHRAATLPE